MRRNEALKIKNEISKVLFFNPHSYRKGRKNKGIREGILYDITRIIRQDEIIWHDDNMSILYEINGVGITFVNQTYFIKIYTEKRANNRIIRHLVDRFDIDPQNIKIEPIGKIILFNYTKRRHRPAFPGVSIGHYKVTAGTFGCLVKDSSGIYILSNNHVLANANNARIGDPILQPGVADGGVLYQDEIAKLARFTKINFYGVNYIDAAIAEPIDQSYVKSRIPYIGKIHGATDPRIGMPVVKFGRTTGLTAGIITTTNVDIKVYIGGNPVIFSDQVVIKGDRGIFSAPGDSGSLIVERATGKAVALLFAGNEKDSTEEDRKGITLGTPIKRILNEFKVKIL